MLRYKAKSLKCQTASWSFIITMFGITSFNRPHILGNVEKNVKFLSWVFVILNSQTAVQPSQQLFVLYELCLASELKKTLADLGKCEKKIPYFSLN